MVGRDVTALQKFLTIVGVIGLATALTLPDRQTPKVIDAAGNATSKLLGTAISGRA